MAAIPKDGSHTKFTVDFDATVMALNNHLYNVEPQTGTTHLLGLDIPGTIETRKQIRKILGGMPMPVSLNQFADVLCDTHRYPHDAARMCELDGVAQQVIQHLIEAIGISTQIGRSVRHHNGQLDSRLLGKGPESFLGTLEQRFEATRSKRIWKRPASICETSSSSSTSNLSRSLLRRTVSRNSY